MKILVISALLLSQVSFAQESSTSFTLEEAEEYGVNNNEKVKNALLDIEIARKKVWETTAIGLPQVSAKGEFQQLLDIPVSVVDASLFNPMAEPGDVMEFSMGQEFSTSATFTASQLIFDGSYIVGLKFSKFFQKMAQTSATNTQNEVKALIREAYYNVLVAKENVALLDSIELVTKTLWEETKIYFESGFIPVEESDQVEIAFNRIRASKNSGKRQIEVAMNLLKLQMGYDFEKGLELSQTLDDVLAKLETNNPMQQTEDVKQNANYIMLDQQRESSEYSLKNEKAAYLPSLGAFFNHSQNAFRSEFDFFENKPWYPTTVWGVTLNIPIMSSGQKIAKVQQAEMKIEQDENSLQNLERSLQFQEIQLKATYKSSVELMEIESSNVDLAKRVYENAVIRKKTGTVSALEVTQLQSQLLTAESNYIRSVMDMLNVKVQLDKLYNQ
ncbi:TolC family protein [Crocinitomix catalasitica]|uniref:TolC family protein n=1 Tax=Crocinitomix catalasitica TaxID=184607 RepID=UPI00146FBD76|nr:TolC family protein [Crocinitomix catalasitica]